MNIANKNKLREIIELDDAKPDPFNYDFFGAIENVFIKTLLIVISVAVGAGLALFMSWLFISDLVVYLTK